MYKDVFLLMRGNPKVDRLRGRRRSSSWTPEGGGGVTLGEESLSVNQLTLFKNGFLTPRAFSNTFFQNHPHGRFFPSKAALFKTAQWPYAHPWIDVDTHTKILSVAKKDIVKVTIKDYELHLR